MKKLRIGIIGTGNIAGFHRDGYLAAENCDIVALCDLKREKAEEFAKYCTGCNPTIYTDYNEMLKKEQLDAVSVTTWNSEHKNASVAALNAGVNVLCEKPMAMNAEEAKEMKEAADRNGKVLQIGFVRRFGPDCITAREYADSGKLGNLYFGKVSYLRRNGCPGGWFADKSYAGGGPLIDIGTHALDLTLWVMNNYKPKYCVGTAYHKLNNLAPEDQGNGWGPWDPAKFTVEDSAFGFIVMENGATIILESSWALNTTLNREAVTSVCGTLGGGDMYDGVHINGVRNGRQYILEPNMNCGGAAFFDGQGDDPAHIREARNWLKAIAEDKDPVVLPEQAFCVTRILEGIYESAKTGKPFYFDN